MPNVTTAAAYQQVLSMSLEDRSSGYEDLVSNNNALLAVLRRKGLWQTYDGPTVRQTLQIGKQSAQWYSGYDQLLNPAIDLFNDAVYTPKQVVVPVILSMQEILNNQGEQRIMNVFSSYISAAERALEDAMDAAIYSDGTANGNKQLTGLATAVPIATPPASMAASIALTTRSGEPRPMTRIRSWRDRRRYRQPRSGRC